MMASRWSSFSATVDGICQLIPVGSFDAGLLSSSDPSLVRPLESLVNVLVSVRAEPQPFGPSGLAMCEVFTFGDGGLRIEPGNWVGVRVFLSDGFGFGDGDLSEFAGVVWPLPGTPGSDNIMACQLLCRWAID
mmetsp:Transcript_10728/g.19464  ORF Transcript_10728/g.19464 Transcript_10728/m.19464 type:complete len:133 (+) Transcript_10728:912-1310(+)